MERGYDTYLAYLRVNSTWSIFTKISLTHTLAISRKPVCPSGLANILCVQHWFQCNILYYHSHVNSWGNTCHGTVLCFKVLLTSAFINLGTGCCLLAISPYLFEICLFSPHEITGRKKSYRWDSAALLSSSCCQQKTLCSEYSSMLRS